MAILREFRCFAHDLAFESLEEKPRCPAGCSNKFVVQEFRTPPSIRSGGTHIQDQFAKQLADDYRLTDMRNDKDGASVMSSTRTASGGTRVGPSEPKAYWNPGLFQPKRGWAQRGEPEPTFNAKAAGLVDGGVPISAIREGAKAHFKKATVVVNTKGKE